MRVEILLVAVFFVGSSCHPPYARHHAMERFHFPMTPASRLEIRVDRGSIELRVAERDDLEIVLHKRARAADEDDAKALFESVRVESHERGDELVVEVRLPKGGQEMLGSRLRADVEVFAPPSSALVLMTADGDLEIRDFRGSLRAETREGRVRLERLEGDVYARSGDGSIYGAELDGNVDVMTEDGGIELRGNFGRLRAVTGDGAIALRCEEARPLGGDWFVSTSDGSISLTVPRGFSARLEASTWDGRVIHQLPLKDARISKDRLLGRLGERPEHTVALKSFDGTITIQQD